MIDDTGAVQTAAETESVSAAPQTAQAQNEPPRASIDRAFAAVDAGEGGTPPSDTQPSEPSLSHAEAPAGFSAEAKAAWQALPEPIKAETWRVLRELESGLGKYQKDFEPLKPWFDLARQHNTTVHEAMERYTTLDRSLLSDDPKTKLAAINAVLAHAGMTPADFAKLDPKAQSQQPQPDTPLNALRQELADLRNQMGGISSTLDERRSAEAKRELDAFAAEHPRLADEKFAETFNRLLTTGMADGLAAAYDMADRLNPAPPQPKPPADQTRKGQLSVTGAPASGSNPVNRKAPATARESLDRSFASLGLG